MDPYALSNAIIIERHKPLVEAIEQEMQAFQGIPPMDLLVEWVQDREASIRRVREHHRRMIRLQSQAARTLDEALAGLPDNQ